MEWAFAGGRLYVLQARPITAPAKAHPVEAKNLGTITKFVEKIKSFFKS